MSKLSDKLSRILVASGMEDARQEALEELRALAAKLEAMKEVVGYAMDVLTNSGLDDVVDYIEETWPESVAAAQKEQSNEAA